MAIKKSELYSTLWKSCDELRGGMDASQYKDYVLVLLFMKYVSDKAASNSNYLLDVPPGARFADMVALKGNKNIGEEINKIIARLAEANDLKGVIDVADFNDPDKLGRGQEMVDRLTNLIAIFDKPELDFRGNRAEGDDLLGDAYEYLMRHFATESGKSKGQFYTPAEVSRIMAKVLGVRAARSANQTIYDPTCGSGSLLLKAHDEAQGATGLDLAIYGQEMDVATAALARMNMILHDAPTAEITPGGYSTLANPQFKARDGALKTFDFVVANPPFSNKAWRNGFKPEEDEYKRFSDPWTVPPAKNGDYAFLLHIIASMKSTGKAAVILPHGVLFRGNAEAYIRREIVRRSYVKGIIGLPSNLFYGTGIPACVVVLDKAEAATRKGVFMIDASRGFMKDGAKNRLRAQDIHRIVDVFNRQAEVPRYSRFVPHEEIERNEFNLNIPRYLDSSAPIDVQDIDGHLRGGIPERDIDALGVYWANLPDLRTQLFQNAGRPGYSELCVPVGNLGEAIAEHPDVISYNESVRSAFDAWLATAAPEMLSFGQEARPKDLIEEISETLLRAFPRDGLIDPYGLYQHLMDFWDETMQDDAYLVTESGWRSASKPRLIVDEKGKPKETPDFVSSRRKYKSDLLPAAVVVERFFPEAAAAIDSLERTIEETEVKLGELAEEHGSEEGLLEDAVDDSGRLTKAAVTTRLREISRADITDASIEDERRLLDECDALFGRLADTKRKLRATQADLQEQIGRKYDDLSEDEVRDLAVNCKWVRHLDRAFANELQLIAEMLTARLTELAQRYSVPLPQLVESHQELTETVEDHLRSMGYVW